jgi:DNA-binding PadR family transcriptional regulator
LILASLAEEPKHGYAIAQDIESFAGVSLGTGTLYGALSRLRQRNLIEALPPRDRRRPYRISAQGQVVLRHQLQTLAGVLASMSARLPGPTSP